MVSLTVINVLFILFKKIECVINKDVVKEFIKVTKN